MSTLGETYRTHTAAWTERGDFAAFQQGIQATVKHQSEPRLAPLIGQWEVLITFYKHGVEIPRMIGAGGPPEEQHRAMLTGLLSMGEMIYSQTKSLDDDALQSFGYNRKFIESNLMYLRDKYLDWYSRKDDEQIKSDLERILSSEPASIT